MKWLLSLLIVVVVAFFVADTIAENTAERRIEGRLATSVEGAEGVRVDVTGALFLPQLFGGGFDSVKVSIDRIVRRDLVVEDIRFQLRDLDLSLGELQQGGNVFGVAGGRGRASISETSLNAALRRQGISARIDLDNSATVTAGGTSRAVQTISTEGGSLVFDAPPVQPVELDLPSTVAALRYSGARVVGDRLILSLAVAKGRLEL